MSKNRVILAVIGGVIAIAVLVAAFLTWQAYSANVAAREGDAEEGTDGLETVNGQAETLSRKPIYPCKESVEALKTDEEALSGWRTEALRFAARGDRPVEKTTAASFKTFIVTDARRIAALKGAVNGSLVKPDFTFGPFKDYIAEGKMPPEAQLTEIQRRWDDVATIAETLAACGVDELTDVAFRDDAAAKEAAEKENASKNRRARGGKKAAKKESTVRPSAYGYTFSFLARPASLIKVVNALTTCERFVVIDSLTFDRTRDVFAEALGGDEKKKADAQQGGRRGRRRGGRGGAESAAFALAAGAESAAKDGIVTDPAADVPFAARMSVTVYDFRTLEPEAETKDDVKKGKEASR